MKIIYIVFISLIMAGCSTTGHFKVPEDSSLYVYKRSQPVEIKTNSEVTTNPFFLDCSGCTTREWNTL